jgi:hypothetical protein
LANWWWLLGSDVNQTSVVQTSQRPSYYASVSAQINRFALTFVELR